MAGEPGFEPGLTASKAAVLPLHNSPVVGVTGFEPAASRSQSARSTPELHPEVVGERGFEPPRDCSHYALNVARLPFRHLPWLPD